MTDTAFDAILERQLGAYADGGVRSFDGYAIADSAISSGRRARSALRWRRVLVVGLAMLALVAAALAGSWLLRDHRHLPPPFGPARNGLIAYSVDDDLFVADPATATNRLLAAGMGRTPIFSRDGTTIATVRTLFDGQVTPLVDGSPCWTSPSSDRCTTQIVLTTTDGRSRALPSLQLWSWASLTDWSADGRWFLVEAQVPWLVASDGSEAHRLQKDSDGDWYQARFGGNGGPAIWSFDTTATGERVVRTFDLDGRPGSTIIPIGRVADDPPSLFDVSLDGARIAVGQGGAVTILDQHGTAVATVALEADAGNVRDTSAIQFVEFSPDGSHVVIRVFHEKVPGTLGPSPSMHLSWFSSVVLPADGSSTRGVEVIGDRDRTNRICSWAPDAKTLFCNDGRTVWQVDASSGAERDLRIPVSIESPRAWQRLAVD